MKEITFPPTHGFKPYRHLFGKKSVKHPAKANLYMLKWIIANYTKKGDTILDPMAGTYSTCIMASLLNRNSIGVEYEDKFYKMGLENVKQLQQQQNLEPIGKIVVLKGDVRSLSDVLVGNNEEIDAIITSPPYANPRSSKGTLGEDEYEQNRNLKNPCGRGSYRGRYSKDEDNIGNLNYGKINAIVTSPPYEGSMEGGTRHHVRSDGSEYELAKEKRIGNYYSDDKNQIGNFKKETYLSAMLQVYNECYKVLKKDELMILITKNFFRKKKEIRLDLDTIKLCQKAGFTLADRWYRKLTSFSFWVTIYYKKYGLRIEYEDILVFRKEDKRWS